MIRTLLAEARIAALGMVRTLGTEAVAILLGAPRIVCLAGATRAVDPAAKTMPRMPLAETAPVDGPMERLEGAPSLLVKHCDPRARRACGDGAGAEQQAAQQHAMR
jgi:hypothetical protein